MKWRILLSLMYWIIALAGNAQEVVKLYEGIPPGNLPVEDREAWVRPASGRPSVVNVTNPGIIVFKPAKPNALHPAVIICPGGGYLRLTIQDGGYDIAAQLAQAGITAIVLKYRTWRDSAYRSYRDLPLQDYRQAVRLVKANAVKWQIDTTRIGVMGLSAGGHLAAMASVIDDIYQPAFSLLAYPVISFTDSFVSKTLKSRSALLGEKITNAEKEKYSPELHVTRNTAPAFIVHAQDDTTSVVGNSIQYYQALLRNRIPAEMLLYQKGGHGFASYNKAEDSNWIPIAIKWLSLNGFFRVQKQQL